MKKWVIKLILVYKKLISPLFEKRCRFYPSCSEYALEAVETYGVIKGILLSIWRILRCNPFHPGGFDPVNRLKEK